MLNNSSFQNLFSNPKFTKVISLLFSLIATLVFVIYLLTTTSCIIKTPTMKRKKIILFWVDFFLVIIIALLITSVYLYILITEKTREELNESTSHLHYILVSLMIMLQICFNTIMVFNIIKLINLISNYKKFFKVKGKNINEISNDLKNINIYSIINKTKYIIQFIIVYVIQLVIYALFLFFKDKLVYVINTFKFVSCFLFILMMFVKGLHNKYKSKLVCLNFYNNNIVILKLFNSQMNFGLYVSEIISYKILIDSLGIIPIIMYSFIGRIHSFSFIISLLLLYAYVLLSGNLYMTIDRNNRTINLTGLARWIFFFRKINYVLDNDVDLYEDFDFELNEVEAKVFSEVNASFLNDNIKLDLIENAYIGNVDLLDNLNERLSDVRRITTNMVNVNPLQQRQNNKIAINTPENYYIVCKMVYRYFEQNQLVYMENERKMEEEASPFKKLMFSDKEESIPTFNMSRTFRASFMTKEYIDGLSRVSRMSQLVDRKIKVTYRTGFNNLFSSVEEKEYREAFRKKYAMYEPTKSEFRIETLFNNELLELFPFYQIHVQDLLKSLDPSNNKDIFYNLATQKNDAQNVSLLSTNSGFYTHDSFLFFEVYEANDFPDETLHTFVVKYKEYLLNTLKEMEFTFIPIIVGIYNITILDNDKLIFLYRHPLSFTHYSQFNQWINFIVTEEPESIKVSTELNSVIDINEIEIKNNIKLPSDQYQELKTALLNDISFIVNTLNMNTFPIANLFVGSESIGANMFNIIDSMSGEDNLNQSSGGAGTVHKDKSFNVLLKDQTLDVSMFGGNVIGNKMRKEGGSELVSLFEKEYLMVRNNNNYTIKIYFTNFFRKSCAVNEREKEKQNERHQLSADTYCMYVQDRLLNYLHESKELFRVSGASDIRESVIRDTIRESTLRRDTGSDFNFVMKN